jgi:putative Ca2+/H+ antiporter (TMEM165/GDT1 family)
VPRSASPRFEQFYPVVIGTTLGMMLASLQLCSQGQDCREATVRPIRIAAAVVFAALGVDHRQGDG